MVDLTPLNKLLVQVEKLLGNQKLPEAQLASSLSESWFSNTLAWFLDPRAGHGFGTLPSELFLGIVAKARSKSARRASHLKFGKEGKGRGATSFRLGNVAVVREFFLSGEVMARGRRGTRFCDIVMLDLDPDDGLFVAIENKLFTCNRPQQLTDYHVAVESKFQRATTREYVYLTLQGDRPANYAADDKTAHQSWLAVSWIRDLLPDLFDRLASEVGDIPGLLPLRSLCSLLEWLKQLSKTSLEQPIDQLRREIVGCAARCLHAELERLRGSKPGQWEKHENSNSFSLEHSRHPSKKLHLELLPDCSVTIQTRVGPKQLSEKILVPFGAHPDQVLNLLQLAARDVYSSKHFDHPELYKDDVRRRRKSIAEEDESLPLFKFIHRHQHSLRVCFLMNKAVRRELELEYEREGEVSDEPVPVS